VQISLSGDERTTLQRWARRHSSSQALALRCRIVLACAEDRTNTEIAAALRVNPVTVSKWRHRFAVDRLDGLVDAPRPGAARTIGDDVIEAVVGALAARGYAPPAGGIRHVDPEYVPAY